MDVALRWLDRCDRHHQGRCWRDEPAPVLPSRVLDLGETPSGKIFVCEPTGQRGRYICLSYCWGKADFIRSTKGTLQSHMAQGIAIQDLPRTFQDAIRIARAFEVQYLWIDSLCIIQDSEEDWEKEANGMAEVYSNSYLTIAATQAGNPNDGCFSIRHQATAEPVYVRHTHHFPNSQSEENTRLFPLLSRGWAYQERILPPRVLHFGPDEIVWDYYEERWCECGANQHYLHELSKHHFFDCVVNVTARTKVRTGGSDEQKIQDLWRLIVVQYTAPSLTEPSDKLHALSGLAKLMSKARNGEYLAGLWSGSIAADLLWYQEERSEDGHRNNSRVDAWGAPTWSWASVDGPVMYPQDLYTSDVLFNLQGHCEVTKAQCEPGRGSSGQRVITGHITLRCPVSATPVKIKSGGGLWCWMDSKRDVVTEELYFGLVARIGRYEYLLALEMVDAVSNKFRRVGLVKWFQEGEEDLPWALEMRVITII
ncbi:HET-domain-containing protein [Podospora aff. communis PSN243]|uniref:HET-domain-containing protein n=1 Tax=Podospora aff. communis PSN243 TaxID=3040156 RepID=A0AAV9G7C9_9PEZI|nr:HET-domain-containing protein [Podospora aff. communis PSN243]